MQMAFVKTIIYSSSLCIVFMPLAYAAEWKLTPQSEVGFTIHSLGLTLVRAEFPQVSATMQFDLKSPQQATTQFIMQVNSLKLSKPSLKNMILAEDLFDVQHHKTIQFKSKQFKPLGQYHYQVLGDLTLRGVTKPVVFDTYLVPHKINPKLMEVTSITSINRTDFGMKKAIAGMGEKVEIHLIGEWKKD